MITYSRDNCDHYLKNVVTAAKATEKETLSQASKRLEATAIEDYE